MFDSITVLFMSHTSLKWATIFSHVDRGPNQKAKSPRCVQQRDFSAWFSTMRSVFAWMENTGNTFDPIPIPNDWTEWARAACRMRQIMSEIIQSILWKCIRRRYKVTIAWNKFALVRKKVRIVSLYPAILENNIRGKKSKNSEIKRCYYLFYFVLFSGGIIFPYEGE